MTRSTRDRAQALKRLEALWSIKRGEAPLPPRRAFTFEDFRPWYGHIRIIEVGREPTRFLVKLDGSEIVAAAGVDLTGRDLVEVYGSDKLRFLLNGYHKLLDTLAPVYETLHPNGDIINFGEIIRVLLPCGDGARVDHIIYCEYAFDVLHWGRTVFAEHAGLKL